MTGRDRSVAIIHHQLGPYHRARARAFERTYPGKAHFIQLASHEALRDWRAEDPLAEVHTVAHGTLERLSGRELGVALEKLLNRLTPGTVVIPGYSHPMTRVAARWCRRNHAASVLLADSHHLDHPRSKWKELLKRTWVRSHFDAAFTAGSVSASYRQTLGIPHSRMWRGCDVVDNEFFSMRAAFARQRGPVLREELGFPERYFLYVGRVSAEKNLFRLLDALNTYHRSCGAEAWGLVMVGGGPMQKEISRRVSALRRKDVIVSPFRQADELSSYYAFASALVLPSVSEPWGLVVNEAMASGLPILASERCGCVMELVFPGINGYIFDPLRVENLVEVMERITSSKVDRLTMGAASVRIVGNFTPETWATSLADCIAVTLERKRRSI